MASLKNVNRNKLTNDTQRVAFRLISANGQWVSRGDLNRITPSATARARDLRKAEFGKFKVECASGDEIGRGNTTYYRIPTTNVTSGRVQAVFRV